MGTFIVQASYVDRNIFIAQATGLKPLERVNKAQAGAKAISPFTAVINTST